MTQKTKDRLMQALALALALGAGLDLSGCAAQLQAAQQGIQTQAIDPLLTDLSKIGNTAQADLLNVVAVAQAANPPDTDGVQCAQAALAVQADVAKVLTAANTSKAGVLTVAEVASLFQPGSIQYNTEKQRLTSGCAAKAQDVLGAAGVLAVGGAVGALATGQLLPMLAAAG